MKILHLDENHPILIESLNRDGHENIEMYSESKTEIIKIIHQYDIIIIRSRFSIDKSLIKAAKKLKIIARVGAGLENIDINFAKELGIKILSAPEGNRNAVGEHAIGMLLCLMNKLVLSNKKIKNGLWDREASRGYEIKNKVVGIIGYGNMGRSLAKKLKGFNVKVIFYDIKDGIEDKYAKQVDLSTLKKESQIISLHVPKTHLTKEMINYSFISEMINPFWIINTSRGAVINTKDLLRGIRENKVLGAGLDVLEYESSSFNSIFTNKKTPDFLKDLFNCENVIFSPHVAGLTHESHKKLSEVILNKIQLTIN